MFALCILSIGHHCFIHQLVLFCQHGVTTHGPIWLYLFEVGHFHYMMDEHISEYSSFEAFCISVCSSLHTGAYPLLREHRVFRRLHSPSDLVVDPHELSYWGISPSVEFACIVILVSSGFESLDHLLIIILSVQFESGPQLYRSVIVVSV